MSRFLIFSFLVSSLVVALSACSIHLPGPSANRTDSASPTSLPTNGDGASVYGISLRCLSSVSSSGGSLVYQVQCSPMTSGTDDADLQAKLKAWAATNCPATFDLSSFPGWQGCTLHAFPGGLMLSTDPQHVLDYQNAHPEACSASQQNLYGTPQC